MSTSPNRRFRVLQPLSLGLAVAYVVFSVAACDSKGESANPVSPTGSATSAGTQGKPATTTPATITFGNQAGDAITGAGTYAAELLSGSLEFTCCVGQTVNYNFNGLISGPGPTGTQSLASDVRVLNVGSMAIGSTLLTRAIFKTSLGEINFDSSADVQTNSAFVTRVSANTWTVDTSAGDVGVLVQSQTVPDPNHPHKTIIVTSKTYYHLPFRLTGISQ